MAADSDSSGLQGEPGRVVIRTFATHDAADLARAQLEANGIAGWIEADDCGGMLLNLAMAGGVRVLVSRSDEAEAKALLEAPSPPPEFSDQSEPEIEDSSTATVRQPTKFAVGQIFIGVIIGALAVWLDQRAAHAPPETYYHYAANGKADEEWVYRQGRLVEYMQDRNLDGAWDHWNYYGTGGVERAEYDNNFDGKPDETWTYSNGDLITMKKDCDFNGVPDEICTYKYHLIQRMDMRPNGSRFTITREIFTNGVLSEIWRGGDPNGHFEQIVKYDPFFNPISTNAGPQLLLSVP
jgi:hypothetical protein